MSPALAGVAIAVVLGAVVAASARNARTAVLGAILALVAGSFLADPLPDSVGLAARVVGAVLGGYLLWVAARGIEARTGGSRLGWPTELLIALAGAVVGLGSNGFGAPAGGPELAQVAGVATAAVAVAPILNGRDVLRVGLGLYLLLGAAILVRTALGGTPDNLENLLLGGLVAVLGGVVAFSALAARHDGTDGFELSSSVRDRARRLPDAHPVEPR